MFLGEAYYYGSPEIQLGTNPIEIEYSHLHFYRKFCKYINKFKLLFDRIHLTYLKHFVIFTDIP